MRDPYTGPDRATSLAASALAYRAATLPPRGDGESSIEQLGRALRFLWRHRLTTTLAAVALAAWVTTGPAGVAVLAVAPVVLVGGLWWGWPAGRERMANYARRFWRLHTLYRPLWRQVTVHCRLGTRLDGIELLPSIRTLASTRWVDHLLVELVPGVPTSVMEAMAPNFAEGFGALGCRVAPCLDAPGFVWLTLRRADPLTAVVPALEPVPVDQLDLAAIPVGITEDGTPWTVRLSGTHLLIAGATGSGKGSVEQSIIRALAPSIAAGLVELWGIDPKGGMELGPVRPLLARFARPDTAGTYAHPSEPMVELLEEAARVTTERANRLGDAARRKHTPTVGDPAIVVIVDELADLGAYLKGDLGQRATRAIQRIASQGRAPGVTMVGAVQDPRKETLPFRPLFPDKVALRFTDDAADLVLGKGAIARGADCENIPAHLPGLAYVLPAGQREPIRVRAAYVTDDDIAWLVATYGRPTDLEHRVRHGDEEAAA
jgi:S-DNA-T family DNA segregation ATPase FtsK/SpoIIIE